MPNQPQLQSSLGEMRSSKTKQDRTWNIGSLALGKVLKVHPKRYTADVQLFKTNDIFISSAEQEGRYSCKIGVSNAGFSTKYNKPYGDIVPIQKGTVVLVGFIRNLKSKPVILRAFHEINEDPTEKNLRNILEADYVNIGESEINRWLHITPIQDFFSLDLKGNLEVASHCKSFVAFKEQEMDDENFDYDDLTVRDSSGKVLSVDKRYSRPKKMMAVFRDSVDNSETNWLKVIIDSFRTSIKLLKLQKEGKMSMIGIDEHGAIRLRRHLDTKSPDPFDSQDYTEVCITDGGNLEITVRGEKTSTLSIDGGGVALSSDGDLRLTSGENMLIESAKNIVVESAKDLKIDVADEVEVKAANKAKVKTKQLNIEAEEKTQYKSPEAQAEGDEWKATVGSIKVTSDIEITGSMYLNNKRVAVEGDSTSDGATIE